MTTTEKIYVTLQDVTDLVVLSPNHFPATTVVGEHMLNRLRTLHANMATQLNVTTERYKSDMDKIGRRLMNEAEDRGWCSTYDEVIESLNKDLYAELPTRKRTFKFEGKYEVYLVTEIEATNKEEAEQEAREFFESCLDDIDGVNDYDENWISED